MIVYLILAVLGELSILLHIAHPNWSLESVPFLQVSSPFNSFIFHSKYNYHLTKSYLIIRKLLPQRYQQLLLYSLLSLSIITSILIFNLLISDMERTTYMFKS